MAFAGILLGAIGGIVAAAVALAMGGGWLVALAVYAVGGGALATVLIGIATLRPARHDSAAGYAAGGAPTEY